MHLQNMHKPMRACPHAHVQVAPELRERFFGAALELASHDNYCPAWENDEADPSSRPGGDGESVKNVAERVLGLLEVRSFSVVKFWVFGQLVVAAHLPLESSYGASGAKKAM